DPSPPAHQAATAPRQGAPRLAPYFPTPAASAVPAPALPDGEGSCVNARWIDLRDPRPIAADAPAPSSPALNAPPSAMGAADAPSPALGSRALPQARAHRLHA